MYTFHTGSLLYSHESSLRKAHFGLLLAVLVECLHMISLWFFIFLQNVCLKLEKMKSRILGKCLSFTTRAMGISKYSMVIAVTSLQDTLWEPLVMGFSSIMNERNKMPSLLVYPKSTSLGWLSSRALNSKSTAETYMNFTWQWRRWNYWPAYKKI